MYCVRNGLSVDHQAVKDLFALARHGEKQRLKFYAQVKADSPNSCPIMTRFGGVNASLRELFTEGLGDQTSGEKIETLGDIQEVGLSGIFSFEYFDQDKPKAYAGGDGGLKVVEMDEEEKALAKQLRMARMAP
ncbi:unnamed protein product [Ectocarpus sp. 8 AP-2014]